MRCIGIIPARYQSQRYPGKPLALIQDKPMIQWVYERTSRADTVDAVLVATDHKQIVDAVEAFGGQVVLTDASHQSGTDRIAEVAANLDAELIVNIQGDEPLIQPRVIDSAVRVLIGDQSIKMGTLACPLRSEDCRNPNVVKVVFDQKHRALYFSRAPVPFYRNDIDSGETIREYWQHIGLYVYRREFLLEYATWEMAPLEKAEGLEQLRVLERGHSIHVVTTEYESVGVDTPEDLKRITQLINSNVQAGTL